jgi:hypothetical protein
MSGWSSDRTGAVAAVDKSNAMTSADDNPLTAKLT